MKEEFKEFKRVYVGPSLLHTIAGVGGPFETGEEVTITAHAAEKAGIASEKHFDESLPGLFEKPNSRLAKEAIAAREKLLKSKQDSTAKAAAAQLEKVSEKAEGKAAEKEK